MAGRDESAKLQGMLSELAATVGEMGAGRDWGANAIRQIARPDKQAMFRGEEFNLDNSANLMKMAQWAERNGYEDKAKQYMALGYKEKEREAGHRGRMRGGRWYILTKSPPSAFAPAHPAFAVSHSPFTVRIIPF